MTDEPKKPNRRSRRLGPRTPELVEVNDDDAAAPGNETKERASQNEVSSTELLRRLNLHHRHGYGSYNPDAK